MNNYEKLKKVIKELSFDNQCMLEKLENLSQDGNCWVSGDVEVN